MGEIKKVLIVEDDLILNLLYESYLKRLGFETRGELVYGNMAVEAARNLNPDLIIMDVSLEGEMDGIDTMLEVRKFSDVSVIYITGNSDPHHIERARQTNYLDYLIKPIEFEIFKATINRYLKSSI